MPDPRRLVDKVLGPFGSRGWWLALLVAEAAVLVIGFTMLNIR